MNGPTMRERADGSARRTCNPPRSTVRGTTICAIASLEGSSPNVGSLAGKKLMARPPSVTRTLRYINCKPTSARRLLAFGCFGSLDELSDKPGLGECRDVNLRRPVSGLEAASLAITLRDRLHGMAAGPLVVAGDPHRHVAADIDRNGGDIAACIREQAAELEHGCCELVVLKKRNAVLGDEHATRLHAAA